MRTYLAGLALGFVLAGCQTPPENRDIAFAEPPGFRQCPALTAVDWPGSLSWVIERGVDQNRPSYAGWDAPVELSGDDVIVNFYVGANIHVGRTNWVRAARRDGVWTIQTAVGPDSRMPPPPPPSPPPWNEVAHQCIGHHFKAEGEASAELVAALEAFLGDGCRAYIPPFVPAPLYMRDANGRGCEDGALFELQIRTATGTERYSQACAIPGSSLETVMRALERAWPENGAAMTPLPAMSVTLRDWASRYEIEQACRVEYEALELDIDYNDPFQW